MSAFEYVRNFEWALSFSLSMFVLCNFIVIDLLECCFRRILVYARGASACFLICARIFKRSQIGFSLSLLHIF